MSWTTSGKELREQGVLKELVFELGSISWTEKMGHLVKI